MIQYAITFRPKAARQLKKLPEAIQSQIRTRITALAEDPRPHGCKKLAAKDEYRIRVGSYRVLYQINDKTVVILIADVDDRKNIYR